MDILFARSIPPYFPGQPLTLAHALATVRAPVGGLRQGPARRACGKADAR